MISKIYDRLILADYSCSVTDLDLALKMILVHAVVVRVTCVPLEILIGNE